MAKIMDKQANKYLLTINNPKEKGYTHEEIMRILTTNFKTFNYACMADEQGQTYHTHVFIHLNSRVRFSMVKKHFPEAHIDQVKGRVSDNIQYVSKTGKWKDTEKAETCIEGTFEEFGKRPPDSRGKLVDMAELYAMIEDGMSNAEILAVNQDYIMQIEKLDKVRTTLLSDRAKESERLNLKCVYVYGATGTGKTSGIFRRHGYSNVYRVTDYEHPFDGYSCQSVIVFEEFRSSLKLGDMLNYCDIYPIELPARYSNKYACYSTAYIVSNWSLENQYSEVQNSLDENIRNSWKAFLRRIHEVHVYESREKITIYHSVEEYLKRDEGFKPVGETGLENENPFG